MIFHGVYPMKEDPVCGGGWRFSESLPTFFVNPKLWVHSLFVSQLFMIGKFWFLRNYRQWILLNVVWAKCGMFNVSENELFQERRDVSLFERCWVLCSLHQTPLRQKSINLQVFDSCLLKFLQNFHHQTLKGDTHNHKSLL